MYEKDPECLRRILEPFYKRERNNMNIPILKILSGLIMLIPGSYMTFIAFIICCFKGDINR
jgi:hypothetical protein